MDFEWDERKNRDNILKHGLDFEEAPEIFQSPMVLRLDTRVDYGENRWIGIGVTHGRTVVVVFTERAEGKTIRIISLRKALKNERRLFEENLPH